MRRGARLTDAQGNSGFGSAPPTLPLTGETVASITAFLEEVVFPFLANEQRTGVFAEGGIASCLARLEKLAAHNAGAKGALETALLDLEARRAGLPLFRCLGATGVPPEMESDITLSIGSPKDMANRLRFHVGEGFRFFKTKLSGDSDADDARLVALAEAIASFDEGLRLRLDANEAFGKDEEAIRFFSRWENRLGSVLQCVEQPVPRGNLKGLARVAAELRTPVLADEACLSEADFHRLLEADACDGFVVKLAKAQGPLGAARWMRQALQAQKIVLASCMLECHVSLSAMAHAACAIASEFPDAVATGLLLFDLDGAHLLADSPVAGGLCYVGSRVHLADPAFVLRQPHAGKQSGDFPAGLGITHLTHGTQRPVHSFPSKFA